MPDITSPVSTGELVFTLTTDGTLSCFAAESGEELWKASLEAGGEIQASPSAVGEVVLVVSTAGDLIGLRAGREFGELWRTRLEDEFYASPAFANGRVFLRGNKSIWCLGPAGKEIARP
jgi:outer membrane protein assembly factor BamB